VNEDRRAALVGQPDEACITSAARCHALVIPMVALEREIQKGGNNGENCSREKAKEP
jgi:hypothetical protein